jgi:XTP/dITP diphosphohydrolase
MARPVLVLATGNRHKAREIRRILGKVPYRVRLMSDYPGVRGAREDGRTLRANAAKKAGACARATGELSLSDDTGLEVDALDGRPGVYSARFAGPGSSYEDNNRKLLRCLRHVHGKKRSASFRCVAALAEPRGRVIYTEGRLRGKITEAPKGRSGFGYDPVFEALSFGKTFAELGLKVKNRISHRAQAFRKMRKILLTFKHPHPTDIEIGPSPKGRWGLIIGA